MAATYAAEVAILGLTWPLVLRCGRSSPNRGHITPTRRDDSAAGGDGFLLIRSRTGLVRDGYLDAWAPDGALLCQSRQMLAVLD